MILFIYSFSAFLRNVQPRKPELYYRETTSSYRTSTQRLRILKSNPWPSDIIHCVYNVHNPPVISLGNCVHNVTLHLSYFGTEEKSGINDIISKVKDKYSSLIKKERWYQHVNFKIVTPSLKALFSFLNQERKYPFNPLS